MKKLLTKKQDNYIRIDDVEEQHIIHIKKDNKLIGIIIFVDEYNDWVCRIPSEGYHCRLACIESIIEDINEHTIGKYDYEVMTEND